MKRLDKSELIFKILAYTLTTFFAICCLYPFIYTVSAMFSSKDAINAGIVVLLPVDFQIDAFISVIEDKQFWICYANTLFLTFYGTVYSMLISILGGYVLSKKKLLFRKQFNFLLVFTMWFSAGMIPTYLNYKATRDVLEGVGIFDDKWLVVIAMGISAFNIIILRNAFESVPKEIEEAAIVDGANEFQILTNVYIPMSKAAIATVGLFYGISRWNGYFWASTMIRSIIQQPLQVYIKYKLDEVKGYDIADTTTPYAPESIIYGMIFCAMVPILLIYPYIQRYFAVGVNLGGVKE